MAFIEFDQDSIVQLYLVKTWAANKCGLTEAGYVSDC